MSADLATDWICRFHAWQASLLFAFIFVSVLASHHFENEAYEHC